MIKIFYCGLCKRLITEKSKEQFVSCPVEIKCEGLYCIKELAVSWSSISSLDENGHLFHVLDGRLQRYHYENDDKKQSIASGWQNIYLLSQNGELIYRYSLPHLVQKDILELHYFNECEDPKTCNCPDLTDSPASKTKLVNYPNLNNHPAVKYGSSSNGVSTNGKSCNRSCSREMQVVDPIRLKKIVTGETHLMAVSDTGQLGRLTQHHSELNHLLWQPFIISSPVSVLSCGKEHVVIATEDGRVFTYGSGSRGQLGHGSTEPCSQLQCVEALEGVFVTVVAAGGWHSAAITEFGDLYVWGWNESGQLGLPNKPHTASSVQTHSRETTSKDCDTKDAKQKTQYPHHAIVAEQVLFQSIPKVVDIPADDDINIASVSCGSRHTAVLTDKHALWTTGWNAYGQLCTGDSISRDEFTHIDWSLSDRGCTEIVNVVCAYWTTVLICR